MKKRAFKLTIMTLLTICLLSVGMDSASARYGWADSRETAQVMYSSVTGNTSFSSTYYLDGISDSDYYVIDNTYGSSYVAFSVIATPPPGLDIVLGTIKMNANDDVLSLDFKNYNPKKGVPESIGWGVKPGERVYLVVLSDGPNNTFDQTYTITFTKTN